MYRLLRGLGGLLWATGVLASPVPTLEQWKITLPIDGDGNGRADEVFPASAGFHPPWFESQGPRLVFRAHAGGARTSSGTAFARSELREMQDGRLAAWSCATSARSLLLEQRLLATPPARPEVVIGQIHDARNDNLMLKYVGSRGQAGQEDKGRIEVLWNNARQRQVLDAAYRLGDTMRVRLTLSAGVVRVSYRNLSHADAIEIEAPLGAAVGGCYFKAGLYLQACSLTDDGGVPNVACGKKGWAPERHDAPEAMGVLEILDIQLGGEDDTRAQ
ncbi:MAG: polysaccharide lyase family 7 protein [Candidatus Dactylopiibacterium sp.]|nr:polysaccharide lyase family 7 protein [Candidatus Dactylopiibacterium sp.]